MNARRLSLYSLLVQSRKELIEQLNAYLHEAALHIIGSFSIASHIYYTTEKYFFVNFFQIFLISSIHGGTESISYIRMCMRVAMRGIPLYSRNTARRHVHVSVCVYTKASKSRQFRLQLDYSATRLWLLYIYLVINKYITSRALVIWTKKF